MAGTERESRDLTEAVRVFGDAAADRPARGLFVLGSPRSGTSWLATIFDAHPDVLYLHEPDIAHRRDDIPYCQDPPYGTEQIAAMQHYVATLFDDRSLRTVGRREQFDKSYRGRLGQLTRKALIYAGKGLDHAGRQIGRRAALPVPDLWRGGAAPDLTVIKSVTALGRIGLLRAARPDLPIVLIIRHPCGHIASVRRGIEKGNLEEQKGLGQLANLQVAREFGMAGDNFAALPLEHKQAVRWAVANSHALRHLGPGKGAYVMRYEDLCEDPEATIRRLFEQLGLSLAAPVRRYISESISPVRADHGYFSTNRDPQKAAWGWRSELPPALTARIHALVGETDAGRLYGADAW